MQSVRACVRPCVRLCVRTESDLRDGWTESDDLLDSDEELPDTGARLLKFSKISILAELRHFFVKIMPFFTRMVNIYLNMRHRGFGYNNLI